MGDRRAVVADRRDGGPARGGTEYKQAGWAGGPDLGDFRVRREQAGGRRGQRHNAAGADVSAIAVGRPGGNFCRVRRGGMCRFARDRRTAGYDTEYGKPTRGGQEAATVPA